MRYKSEYFKIWPLKSISTFSLFKAIVKILAAGTEYNTCTSMKLKNILNQRWWPFKNLVLCWIPTFKVLKIQLIIYLFNIKIKKKLIVFYIEQWTLAYYFRKSYYNFHQYYIIIIVVMTSQIKCKFQMSD